MLNWDKRLHEYTFDRQGNMEVVDGEDQRMQICKYSVYLWNSQNVKILKCHG